MKDGNAPDWAMKLANFSTVRLVLSNKRSKTQEFERIVLTPVMIKGSQKFQAAKFTKTQVFHENINLHDVPDYIWEHMQTEFRQADGFSKTGSTSVKISKKEKAFVSHSKKTPASANGAELSKPFKMPVAPRKITPPGTANSHDRKKHRLIEEGTVVPPLVDMGIFSADGHLVKSMGDKFRQINRFLEIVDDAIDAAGLDKLTIVDFGCGKAYLTFIMYYYLNEVKGIKATMIGLDLKEDVIRKCNAAAKKYGYDRLHFEVGDISQYTSDKPLDMVVTLHACDTATDYALYHAIQWKSRIILSVPCCQHELNSQIFDENLSALTKYGIIKDRFAALATDAIRASLLEYEGYKTQVLEFVDLSHTPKNLLIRAVRTNVSQDKRQRSLNEAEAVLKEFHGDQTLYRLIMNGENESRSE